MEGLLAAFNNLDLLWRANGNQGTNCWKDAGMDYKKSVKGRMGLFMYKANSAWIFKIVPSIYNVSDKKGGIILWIWSSLKVILYSNSSFVQLNMKDFSVLWVEVEWHLTQMGVGGKPCHYIVEWIYFVYYLLCDIYTQRNMWGNRPQFLVDIKLTLATNWLKWYLESLLYLSVVPDLIFFKINLFNMISYLICLAI